MGLVFSILILFIYIIFLFFSKSDKNIPLIGLLIYSSQIFQLASPIFGISLVFLLQLLLIVYFCLNAVYSTKFLKIFSIFKNLDVQIIFCYVIFIFIDHFMLGSSARHEPLNYSFKPIIHLFIIFLLASLAVNSRTPFVTFLSQLRLILWINIIMGGYVLLTSQLEAHTSIMLSDDENLGFNSNTFSILCVQILIFELFFLKKLSIRTFIALFLPSLLCILTQSRSGFMALILVFFIWFINYHGRAKYSILSFIVIIALFNLKDIAVIDRFFSIVDAVETMDGTNLARFQLSMRAILIFLDNPFLGTGIGTFHMFRFSYPETILLSRSNSFVDSHNLYAQLLAETGVIGFGLFVISVYIIFRNIQVYKLINPNIYQFLKINLFLFLFYNLFSHDLYKFYLMIPIFLALTYSKSEFEMDIKS